MAPSNGKYMTSYLMAIAMFALSLTVCEIFAKLEKCQNIELKNEDQDQGVEELRHSTVNVRFHIYDFFRILAVWEHIYAN